MNCRLSELTNSAPVNPSTIVKLTSRLPISQREKHLNSHLSTYCSSVPEGRTICQEGCALRQGNNGGEMAGRNINDVTGVTNC